MCDLTQLLPLSELAKMLPAAGHSRKHKCTLSVYCTRGVTVNGQTIKLQSWKVNGVRRSSVAAYEEFLQKQIDAWESKQ